MGRLVPRRTPLVFVLLLCAWNSRGTQQDPAVQTASAAMQRGDFPAAEQVLRAAVESHPNDAFALSLLGVALDNQKKTGEAEDFHTRAVALSPHSADVLNNYGTHQWIAGQFDKAEVTFSSALAAAPSYFNVLYNLGVMATYTRHYERAHEALEAALKQQPQNIDVLYCLASVEEATRQLEPALMRLAQAAKLDPRRADVQKLLAVTATELGALDDAEAAWDRYLKLVPNDEAARRERGFTVVRMGKLEEGIADLDWFASRHPDDAVGHYELAEAKRSVDISAALLQLDQALKLKPDYTQARAARGSIYYQEGKPESALPDLELVASNQPDDAANLDRLGQTYQALERPADAVRVLRRAAQLAPTDSATALHFARALADAGQAEESKVEMNRFRQLGPAQKKGVPAGLVDYLAMTPEQRRADYRSRVEGGVREHPNDPAAQFEYLKLMIEDRNAGEAASVAKRLATLKPSVPLLADAGRALLAASYYAPARDLLQQAAEGPRAAGVQLDLAIATYHVTGAKAANEMMDRVPEGERGGDYYFARAQMLDASGKIDEAVSALDQALRADPERPALYRQATALLVKNGRKQDALRIAAEGARALPQNREVLLLKATTLEFAGRGEDSIRLLGEIQNRWPEWPNAWLAGGIILASRQHCEEAGQTLETATTLGGRNPEAYFFLADCALHAKPANKDAAEKFIQQALALAPKDPWIQALGARIALVRGDSKLSAERDRQAATLRKGSSTGEPPYLGEVFRGKLSEDKPVER